MEDYHVVKDNCVIPEGKLPGVSHVSYYAVYDGHGGTEVAEFLRDVLYHEIIQNVCETPTNVEGAITKAFLDCDHLIVSKLGDAGLSIGSTAVVCLLLDKTLYMANVGDAEAILGRKNKAKREFSDPHLLTKAHKASHPDEKKRVEQAGGKVFAGRIFGTLAISRAFGDGEMKRPKADSMFVVCEPHIQRIDLTPDDEFIVLACDGLWDRVTHDEACLFVSKLLRYKTLQDAAEFLLDEAIDRNTKDNVTIIVVNLGWSIDVSTSENGQEGAVRADDLSAGFLAFLRKANLLDEKEDLNQSPLRERISSPALAVKTVRKDFYIRRPQAANLVSESSFTYSRTDEEGKSDHQTAKVGSLPSSVSVDESDQEDKANQLMIDMDDDESPNEVKETVTASVTDVDTPPPVIEVDQGTDSIVFVQSPDTESLREFEAIMASAASQTFAGQEEPNLLEEVATSTHGREDESIMFIEPEDSVIFLKEPTASTTIVPPQETKNGSKVRGGGGESSDEEEDSSSEQAIVDAPGTWA